MSGPIARKPASASIQPLVSNTQDTPAYVPAVKPASPNSNIQEPKLNYAQAAGKATSTSGASTSASQQTSGTAAPASVPVQQTSTPNPSLPTNVPMNTPYPNGSAKPVLPPTGPAAYNGSMTPQHHSRTSSTASNYRPLPPHAPHSAKPSMSGPTPYPTYPSHVSHPSFSAGRSSPFPEYHDGLNYRSPPPSRNGSIAGISMARHSSTSSQSDHQIPPSPRAGARPNVAAQYAYPYQNPQAYSAYNHGVPNRGGYRNPSGAHSYPQGIQPFHRGQPPRSPAQPNIQTAPQMYGMHPQMPVQPMQQPGQFYIPTTDQYGQQMQMQGNYMLPQQFHPQQHAFNPTAPPHQMYTPPSQHISPPFTPSQPRAPIHQPMSRSTSVASEINRQTQPPGTPSPAPKEESTSFVKPKKSSAIRIVNPETKTEITFPKISNIKAQERSPSPAVRTPLKTIPQATHSPSPSVDIERPASGMAQRSREEIAEEMKAKVKKTLEDAERKKAEEAETERIAKEKRFEDERKAKEEAERLERERKEEEERKEREEQERLQREKEEAENKAEEERLAADKAREEEEARIAKEKAEQAALDAARLAQEKQEAKTREEAEAAASALVAEEATPSPERRPSFSERKLAPAPLDLKLEQATEDDVQSAAKALKSATFITRDELLKMKYPGSFQAPDSAITTRFGDKGFHYNVEFLFQFKDTFKAKPSEDWDIKIKETIGDPETRNQRAMGGVGRAVSTSGTFQMGQFGKSSPITRHPGGLPTITTGALGFGGIGTSFPPRVTPRNMSTTGQGMHAPASPGGRAQSKAQRQSSRRAPPPPPPPPPPPEPPVEPLPVNPNRWKPQRAETALGPPLGGEPAVLTPEVVQRKVKSLLNKLTLEKFDKITDQILEIAGQSRKETDGRTLRQIIQLTFEKATDEPNFSEMYALFCRKIMETIDPNITDPNVLNKDGQPLTGGQLFRKYLLNRCQEEFERGWKVNLPPKPDDNAVGKEAELLSEAYYTAAKAKRQGLGLVQFIGELFKLNMLIEKIMYECIIRLLGGTDDPHPEPEEVESLCRLLTTVGKALDEGKARPRMNAIYEALDHIRIHSDLESRIKFKILDVLDLRKSGWIGRSTGPTGPKTIQEIHDDAAKAKAEAELARQSMPSRPRQEFGRGDARLDGWNSAPRPSKVDNRAGDLSKLGMVRTSSTSGFGPQMSQFNSMRNPSRKGNAGGNPLTREGSGQSSRTGTPGVATPPGVTSTNSFDIFRNEAEGIKDDELMPPPLRVTKLAAPDDEVAEGGYFTIPAIQTVASTKSVQNFIVCRKGYGQIAFTAPVDLTDIPSLTILREIVEIERGRVRVYPNKSKQPPVGSGLNVPAKISLEKVRHPPDLEPEEHLEILQSTPDTKFISYDAETGLWIYEVEHF